MTKMTDIKIGDIYYLPKHNCHFIINSVIADNIRYTYISGDENTKGTTYSMGFSRLSDCLTEGTLIKMERKSFAEFLYG